MTKRMLIDATHSEETRVVVSSDNRLEEFDFELAAKKQLRGNIYLAKVTRVEPALQAAFVDYGGNRHGFLAFSDIHPDYYRIPISDRQALVADAAAPAEDESGDDEAPNEGEPVETLGGDESEDIERVGDSVRRPLWNLTRQYNIQEVIKRRQILLVQVVKEERGTKGAALTSYLSLAGRYCVLMPNTARSSGGISRKITSIQQRKRLKRIVSDLNLPDGMALIVRTAGVERSKADLKRDCDFLRRTWDQIRAQTLESTAPCLIHEEGDIITRSLRDVYHRDIDEVLVEGDDVYKAAKDFMRTMLPSHAKRVKKYAGDDMPLFHTFGIENQLDEIHGQVVQLKSGGSIVINQTEALVSIDVNSGRATRDRHIEETALRTNSEAAEETARQLRLRDLAGLIVIDFIDMENARNNASVERKLKESMRSDRARLQVGRISPFGLLELSRQRLRPSIAEVVSNPCPTCSGSGRIRSTEATALRLLRALEEEGVGGWKGGIRAGVPAEVALYILNHKRAALTAIEQRFGISASFDSEGTILPSDFHLERLAAASAEEPKREAVRPPAPRAAEAAEPAENGRAKRRRRRRSRRQDGDVVETTTETALATTDERATEQEAADAAGGDTLVAEGEPVQRRRRGRRGGRRRGHRSTAEATVEVATGALASEAEAPSETATAPANGDTPAPVEAPDAAPEPAVVAEPATPKRRRTRRAPKRAAVETQQEDSVESPVAEASATEAETSGDEAPKKPARRRRTRAKPAVDEAATAPSNAPDAAAEIVVKPTSVNGKPDASEPSPAEQNGGGGGQDETPAAAEPRRRGWWNRLLTDRRA